MNELANLAQRYLAAKEAEDKAVYTRRQLGAEIAKMLPCLDDEGTVKTSSGQYTVKVSRGMTRSVDTAKLQSVYHDLPLEYQQCFRWKADLALTAYRALGDEQNALNEFITTKPSSPTIEIKVNEEK